MPRIPEEILECSVYLYPTRENAEQGERFGGSGFLLAVPGDREEPVQPRPYSQQVVALDLTLRESHELAGRDHLYIVTNRHVAEGGAGRFARIPTTSRRNEIVELGDAWMSHPAGDDIAICPIVDRCDPADFYRRVDLDSLLTKDLVVDLWVGPGDDVIMVGRFINHEGRQRNRPSIRFGHIAVMPDANEKIAADQSLHLEGYLIEANSFAGYSGSPVFLYTPPWEVSRLLDRELNPRSQMYHAHARACLWLLGVNWGHLPVILAAYTPDKRRLEVELHAGMLCVAPAWKLLELVNVAELQQLRAQERARWRRDNSAVND